MARSRGRHAAPSTPTPSWVVIAFGILLIVGISWFFVAHSTTSRATNRTTSTTSSSTTTTVRHHVDPLTTPDRSCIPTGCLAWTPVDTWDGAHPVYVTTFHPTGQSATVVAYAAWMRWNSVDVGLYPGYKGPGPTSLARGPEAVPTSGLPRLLATFNSGFYEADNPAGFYTNHTLYFPMVKGEATLVRTTDGRLSIVAWRGGPHPGPSVIMARQNLTLLVDHGRPTALSRDNTRWGLTLGGVPAVWRSAIGVDAKGNLLYVAAPLQTSASLASILVRLHAVSAMQLDINPEWPIFVSYSGRNAVGPLLRVANPNQIPGRFLYSSTKDFFAVFATRHVGEATPW